MITTIFCEAYDFVKQNNIENLIIEKCRLHQSEIITIQILYLLSNKKNFKSYWFDIVEKEFKEYFRKLISYTRFIEIKQKYRLAFEAFLEKLLTKNSILSFIDSFCLATVHIKREKYSKTLKSISKKTKSTMGWVFGQKLFLAIDAHMNLTFQSLRPANIADNNAENLLQISKKITGDVYADRGFMVNQNVKEILSQNQFILHTRQRKNAINKKEYTEEENKNFARRISIESVGNVLKNDLELEHTRHRSIDAYFVHIFSVLIAYILRRKYSSLKLF